MDITPTVSSPIKRGDGRYAITISMGSKPDGSRNRVVVTRKTRKATVAAAKAKLEEIESGVINGGKTTVATWLDYWLDRILATRGNAPTTLRSYRDRAEHSIAPTIGDIQLRKLTAAHVRDMHSALEEQGRSISTSNLAHTVLTLALADAVAEGLIGKNVALAVPRMRGTKKTRPAMTAEQARQLLRSCIRHDDPATTRRLVALLIGSRQGELIGLTWDRVDFDAKTITIDRALVNVGYAHGCESMGSCGQTYAAKCPMVRLNVKRGYEHVPVGGALVLGRTKTTASVRIVPMIAPVEAALRQHRARQPFNEYDLVWATDEGRAIHPRVDHRSWKRALDLAELPPVPLHSTRHTAATLLQGLKVTEAVRMKIVGHNSQSQHREYAHVDMTLMREALETYGDVLELTA